ncbi:MAG: NeuD/PglB/VioB family sugar acetyltransferase [Proteobacteria bacterium]|nr:NeuD/PglB/VioB family sugar acetyltransferase [Pseudomonadota bacterium]
MKRNIILWGATGQSIVNRSIIELNGDNLVAIFDDTVGLKSPFADVQLYTGWDGFNEWMTGKDLPNIYFNISIGNPHGKVRVFIANKLKKLGLKPISLIHPSAIVDKNVLLGEGLQIMAGSVVQSRAVLGDYVIINTNANIDHEVIIEEGCEIGPGATLCGNIYLKKNSWVCAGATVMPRLIIGEDSVLGAGSLLTKSIDNRVVFYGTPAKFVRKI